MDDPAPAARWCGQGYARASDHHRAHDDWFLDRHRPEPGDVVVDLGCGSGEFSARLAALVPDGHVIGVDQDPSMLEAAASHRLANLEFRLAAAEELDGVVAEGSADLVVSRAMLHWLPLSAYPRVFGAVYRVLRPGGWYHSESAGTGNVPALASLIDDVATRHGLPRTSAFPDAGTVFDLVEASGFEIPPEGVRTVAQRRSFTRDQLVGVLRTQPAVALTRHVSDDDAAAALVDELAAQVDTLRRRDGSYDQTFVRLEILARRPRLPMSRRSSAPGRRGR